MRDWFSAIVSSSEDGIIGKSAEGVIRSWNTAATRLFGYLPEEILGQPIYRLTPFDVIEEERWILSQIVRGTSIEHYESERLHKNGFRFRVGLTVSPIRNAAGAVIGASEIVRRLADDRPLKDELLASEERYRSLFKHMEEEVHYWQLLRNSAGGIETWRLLDINPAGLRSWGKSLEETRGKLSDEIFPGTTEFFRPFIERAFAVGKPYRFQVFFPPLRQHGLLTCVPLGERFILTGLDITEQLRAQEEREDAARREVLLREIHHRLQNNLQVISSLLRLQRSAEKGPATS